MSFSVSIPTSFADEQDPSSVIDTIGQLWQAPHHVQQCHVDDRREVDSFLKQVVQDDIVLTSPDDDPNVTEYNVDTVAEIPTFCVSTANNAYSNEWCKKLEACSFLGISQSVMKSGNPVSVILYGPRKIRNLAAENLYVGDYAYWDWPDDYYTNPASFFAKNVGKRIVPVVRRLPAGLTGGSIEEFLCRVINGTPIPPDQKGWLGEIRNTLSDLGSATKALFACSHIRDMLAKRTIGKVLAFVKQGTRGAYLIGARC